MISRFQCEIKMLRRTVLLAGVALFNASLQAQSTGQQDWEKAAGSKREFEVASVRPDTGGARSYSNFSLDNGNVFVVVGKNDKLNPDGTLFSAKNQTLMRYIVFAYRLNGDQELALRFDYYKGLELHTPDWVRNNRYDVEARTEGPATKDQMRLMMQSLLADRFKLAVRWETRQASVFELALEKPGKLGPQIRPHPASDDCSQTKFSEGTGAGASALDALPIPCGEIAHLPPSAPGSPP